MKNLLSLIPEIYFIGIALFYWADSNVNINYLAIVVIAIAVFQIVVNKKLVGLVFGFLLTFAGMYLVIAWLSDFQKFETHSAAANNYLKLLVVFLIPSLIMSVFMMLKYAGIKVVKRLN